MSSIPSQRLAALSGNIATLRDIRRGIEKESLRVDPEGHLAQTRHPTELGSPLTHPRITTDFAEALLEFITPVSTDIDESLEQLTDIHRLVYAKLHKELLWPASMPCVLGGDAEIPVAQYGSSNVARMKTLYRLGLGRRYGRRMQTIAGIHYNFSVPDELWQWLATCEGRTLDRDYVTERYFDLIRNFRRYAWLLIYLYGAAPAICKTFLDGGSHQLEYLHKGTLYAPFGTSLRMGDLGYQSEVQSHLDICYNSLDNYIQTLRQAIVTPHPAYLKIPDNEQLAPGLLQIENEFYSPIRPKRVTESGEIPLGALKRAGVEYIEVRCIDVNPDSPLGITREQIQFLDSFLLYCLLADSPRCNDRVYAEINRNQREVVNRGREPGLSLTDFGEPIALSDWAGQLLDGIETVAEQLDRAHKSDSYRRVIDTMRERVRDPDQTPSAQMLQILRDQQLSYFEYMMDEARGHAAHFAQFPLSEDENRAARQISEDSLKDQHAVEDADDRDFEQYLREFYRQYDDL